MASYIASGARSAFAQVGVVLGAVVHPRIAAVLLSDWSKDEEVAYLAALRRAVDVEVQVRAARRAALLAPSDTQLPATKRV